MSKRHLSEAQLKANRENAKKSTGPRTEQGKLRSSMNSWKHGITAKRVILDGESEVLFEQLIYDFRYRFQPADGYELRLVDSIAVIQWHMDRLRYMESCMIQVEMLRPGVTGELTNVCIELLPTIALRNLAEDSSIMPLLNSVLNRLSREHARLHDTFLKMRQQHPPISPAVPDTESNPEQEQQPSAPQNEQYPQNEAVPQAPAAISNIRSIVYKSQPVEHLLVRAA